MKICEDMRKSRNIVRNSCCSDMAVNIRSVEKNNYFLRGEFFRQALCLWLCGSVALWLYGSVLGGKAKRGCIDGIDVAHPSCTVVA